MYVLKRILNIAIAAGTLVAVSPLLVFAAIGIKLTSPGPILYRAPRIGRDRRRAAAERRGQSRAGDRRQAGYRGHAFTMYKFRTMRVSVDAAGSPITAFTDSRVFGFGKLLRATKIDELPQLFNIIKGDMALVGPRPEAPEIVRSHYTPADIATLQVAPGLTSPGTLYYYTHCETMLATDAVVETYVERLLPAKLAIDRVYLKHATLPYDIRVIFRTAAVIVARMLGSRRFPDPPELPQAGIRPPIDHDSPRC